MSRPAIFLDRDGVINVEKNYVHRVEDFEFVAKVPEALLRFQALDYALVVVTNQSGIGRGYYTQEDFDKLTEWMLAQLVGQGVHLTDVYHCPEAPEAQSPRRKPAPGMLLEAAQQHDLDLAESWMVGDRETDIEAAHNAGVQQTILIRSGQPAEIAGTKALYVCSSLFDTVRIISES